MGILFIIFNGQEPRPVQLKVLKEEGQDGSFIVLRSVGLADSMPFVWINLQLIRLAGPRKTKKIQMNVQVGSARSGDARPGDTRRE